MVEAVIVICGITAWFGSGFLAAKVVMITSGDQFDAAYCFLSGPIGLAAAIGHAIVLRIR